MTTLFKVAKPLSCPEPTSDYFEHLAQAARRTLVKGVTSREDAWTLCEFIDAVDSRDLPLEKQEYRISVQLLTCYLAENKLSGESEKLAQKSWAAHTLYSMLSDTTLNNLTLAEAA